MLLWTALPYQQNVLGKRQLKALYFHIKSKAFKTKHLEHITLVKV
ncbi:hypothetical protein amad1_09335 [Alteromonas mediterranea DE1]|uniref:Uncharacterized protein n=2 Tax=Alteromonas mediterranea TaxID=314275 RepID=S5AGH2_9ALTE|nr:hypothetical protein MADE_1008970 [Alteromonas mediterranea DE]AFV85374.1 hypothetical protein amad1_09335 [Alteromonas mediterranea DE1]AGP77861.1 hypothetical protein I633_09230 [Alteromonas mediterranea 615]AGP81684.1 hypothetical protein I533_08555 [Alteromonas mediterranea MED64]AGP85442.1 hypothetical protein I607_08235 [Alteromonas mediterranea U4]AGP89565.1 hypothetical protein I876_08510 [Alteromonas mediterranea U7]AGP93438.1 hypothetical protein I634_08615 [Alteromonas mediterra